ncbi:peptidylprolyl isomerase [Congregibacter brevis]|uniref:Peptidylprolyl isomerase n=1 Tax=Congregibacter brevis TaxID=3081201 RepID=A0ABZ0I9G0_9GAMM|nr:peptidylprolyl isomerase [Congregibacter sp. IMCC45268]
MSSLRYCLRDPVVVFFALGTVFFLVYALLNRESTTPITLSQSSKALLISEWEMLTGRSAQPQDVELILEDYYQRELLFREGMAAELYRSDPSIRELLIEVMQQRVTGEIADPSAKDLVNFYADNIDRYYSEATISFSQQLFASAPDDPENFRAELSQKSADGGISPWQGKEFPDYGVSMVRGLFGQPLLEVLERVSLDTWQGPYESRQGWHYFRVKGRTEPVLLPFERVRDQVLADYQAEAVASAVKEFTTRQADRYPLELSQ